MQATLNRISLMIMIFTLSACDTGKQSGTEGIIDRVTNTDDTARDEDSATDTRTAEKLNTDATDTENVIGPQEDTSSDSGTEKSVDRDSDGWTLVFDCNDLDSTVNPDMLEDPANEKDDNCNEQIDESVNTGLYDWDIYIAVDNQFDIYFGTPMQTTGEKVGHGTDWTEEYHFTATGRAYTDYMYVATTSDQSGAQGFIGQFTNVTLERTTVSSDPVWEVFPAGQYLEELKSLHPDLDWPEDTEWPKSLLPTQAQVDAAIAYGETRDLWVEPFRNASFDNDPATDPTDGTPWTWNPWYHDYPNIADEALWIWHDAGIMSDGSIPSPFRGSNQNEFLVFRVEGAVSVLE